MKGICGAECEGCPMLVNKKCEGCKKINGCPFGKKCFIANYIDVGGQEAYESFKKQLVDEINALNIEGMSKVTDLVPLNGVFVNMEYTLPNGTKVKYLHDDEIYLGTQVENIFNDKDLKTCFGIVANMNFILVCSYEENGVNPELLLYKKR